MRADKAKWLLWAAALMLVLAMAAGHAGRDVNPRRLAAPLGQLSLALGKWRALGKDAGLDARTLEVLKPSSYLLRQYMAPDGDITAIFISFFSLQKEGQIIHSPRHCLPGSGWRIDKRERVRVPGPDGGWLVNHLRVVHGLRKLSVLYWYQGRGRIEYDEYLDRLNLLIDGVFFGRTDGALVRLTTQVRQSEEETVRRQIELAAELIPALNKLLPPPAESIKAPEKDRS